MKSMLDKNHVRIHVKAADWEDAIRQAGDVLLREGSIQPAYIDNMIQSVKNLGPYIVIMPKLALAHSAPCDAVQKSDIALITLDEPVDFGSSNGPVSVVLCLACTDSSSHIERLSQIAGLLMEENTMIKIQAVCGFGCGSSLFLKMKLQEVLKENNLEAEIFCGDVGTCTSTPCDAIFTSEELGDRVKDRASVPVVIIKSFVNKKEVTEKTLAFFETLK